MAPARPLVIQRTQGPPQLIERPHFAYESNACSGGGNACKHYTQMVWAKTSKIGCGKAQWSVGAKHYVLWVCNYAPPGNISGQRPY